MRILIVEDETQAAQLLENLVKELEHDWVILDKLDTVKSTVRWLVHNPMPDLIFMDIQLADGLSFEIFDSHKIDAPVIFTTAYNEYALKAFKVNSIDYILKPLDREELKRALEKFKKLKHQPVSQHKILESIGHAMQMLTRKYKERFMIRVGEHLRTIEVSNILYFYSQEKATFCYTTDNRSFILDYTLEQLDEMVDPQFFFRINRKYTVSAKGIQDIINHTNSRLKLILKGSTDADCIVAREKVQEFKNWLDR
jgi:DNA-binding LytR/AlgR family response regulator